MDLCLGAFIEMIKKHDPVRHETNADIYTLIYDAVNREYDVPCNNDGSGHDKGEIAKISQRVFHGFLSGNWSTVESLWLKDAISKFRA